MSGSTVGDADTFVTWWARTATIVHGSCAVWMYIPKADNALDVAGNPTYYNVTAGKDDSTIVGTFSINQAAHAGTWVSAGVFKYDTGRIAVNLVNQGVSAAGGRHAAAQMGLECKAR